MKYKQKGFTLIILVILIIVVIGGGGFYVYKEYVDVQNTQIKNDNVLIEDVGELVISSSTQTAKEVDMKVVSKTKVFTGWNDIYSFSYPENWLFEHNSDSGTDDACIVASKRTCISVAQSQYTSYNPPLSTSNDPKVKQVTIGTNTFNTYSDNTYDGLKLEYYEFFIGKIQGREAYVGIQIQNPEGFKRSDINLVLSTMKPGPFNGSIAQGSNLKATKDAQVKLDISSLRSSAEIIYNNDNSYSNLCDTSSSKNQSLDFTKKLKSIQSTIGKNNIFCTATAEKFVIYTQLSTGLYVCSDSTGSYYDDLKDKPKTTSCK